MTREQAINKIEIEIDYDYDIVGYEKPDESMTSFSKTINLINKIYDDFKSQTCENCKHLYVKEQDLVLCLHNDNCQYYLNYKEMEVTFDFGCNKFSCKEAK